MKFNGVTALKAHLKQYWAFYLSGVLIAGLIAGYFAVPTFQSFANQFWEVIWSDDEQRISRYFRQFGLLGPLLLILLVSLYVGYLFWQYRDGRRKV